MLSFSIFLPVRNGWPYVQDCVGSILQQSYPHFELVVLDNQSTDGTVPWISGLKDSRVRLITSAAPLSITESWARVNHAEKREYMTLIGHDDMLDPDFLAITVDLIRRHPQASLYQTGSRLINAAGKTIRACGTVPERETAADYLTARLMLKREVFGTGYVMRSKDYDRVGGIPSFERLFYADDALWLMLAQHSYKAADARQAFSVRIHPKSESASLPSAWPSMLLGLNQFSEFLQQFVQNDAACKAVFERLHPQFLLNRHRNVYMYALIDACRRKVRLERETLRRIQSSLAGSAPALADQLGRDLKVKMLQLLNSLPIRDQVRHLWDMYYRLATRAA